MMKRWVLCCIVFLIPWIVSAQWSIQSVTQQTTNVKQYEKTVFDISIAGAFANPFDESDISLDVVLTSPSSKTLRYPCFYVSGDGTASQWQARINLREAGSYSGQFELKKSGVLKSTVAIATLDVAATAKDGFLKKKDNWSFQFDSGKPFRGIGENVAWEGRSWEPDSYTYDYFLDKLESNGGNFFRTWSSAWNLPLEWKTVVDTKRYTNSSSYFHPQGSERLDELVDLCEARNLFMMLTLGWHGELQTADRWNINVYNAANGGPASTPTEFFTSIEAIKQYKNRLRYIIARWGYSTSIAAIEFFNEIDNAVYDGTESTIAIPHNAVTQWHDVMSTYMKNNDPYNHLLTTSVSHREITGLFNVANLDVVQKHVYNATATIPAVINDLESRYSKPFVAGEFGYDWDWNNITPANGANLDFDFKRGLWYGLFSPTPIMPMSWWWEFFDQRGTSPYFRSIQTIAERMNTVANGNYTSVTTSTSSLSIEAYAVKCSHTYFTYILNNSSSQSNSKTITLSGISNDTYHVESFDPENRTYTTLTDAVVSGNNFSIPVSLQSKTSAVYIITPTGNTQGIQTAFSGTPTALPGTLQAEDFDNGGEGIAYHDYEAANLGGQYRNTEGVDIETCNAGGFNITNTITGEWLEYTVDAQLTGIYSIKATVAATGSDKAMVFTLDNEQISEPITVSNTGGAQSWNVVTVETSVITKGIHTLRVLFNDNDINLDKIDFEIVNQAPSITLTFPKDGDHIEIPGTVTFQSAASDADGSIAKVEYFGNGSRLAESTQDPFSADWTPTPGTYLIYANAIDNNGLATQSSIITIVVAPSPMHMPFPDASAPHTIPGKIEAEDVDAGAEGVAYHDLTPTNIKGAYRTDVDFDIEACTDTSGGFDLADIQATEWVLYSVAIAKTAKYDFTFRVATQMSAQSFSILVDDKVVAASVSVPNTGSWQTWRDVTVKGISLSEGSAVLKLLFNSEFFNLNYMAITESAVVTAVAPEKTEHTVIYPNPSHEEINLILSPSAREVKIFNINGVEVYSNQDITTQQLSIKNAFPAGLYLIVINYKDGSAEHYKALIRP